MAYVLSWIIINLNTGTSFFHPDSIRIHPPSNKKQIQAHSIKLLSKHLGIKRLDLTLFFLVKAYPQAASRVGTEVWASTAEHCNAGWTYLIPATQGPATPTITCSSTNRVFLSFFLRFLAVWIAWLLSEWIR